MCFSPSRMDAYILHKLCIDDLISVLVPTLHVEQFYDAFIAPDPYLRSLYETISTNHPTTHSRSLLPTRTQANSTSNTDESTRAKQDTPRKPSNTSSSSSSSLGIYRGKYPILQDGEHFRTMKNQSLCWIYTLRFSNKCLSYLTPDLLPRVPNGIEFLSCEQDMDAFQKAKTLVFPTASDNPWSYNINLAKNVKVARRPIERQDLHASAGLPRPLPCILSTLQGT